MNECGNRIADVEWKLGVELGTVGDGCNVVDEGGDPVDGDNEAVVGNIVFAGARILEETVRGGNVFVDARVIDVSGEVVDGNEWAKG